MLQENDRLQTITFDKPIGIIGVGGSVKEIRVTMERGQVEYMPWAVVVHEDGHETHHNISKLASFTPVHYPLPVKCDTILLEEDMPKVHPIISDTRTYPADSPYDGGFVA
jgi:hypothetical protein